ncbi:MAG: sigma-70 family RNA polymerase sigma factor [Eubacteriales bacterium]|nr:sigma-70 family RNA polymerase sigma factor [Eubacteriales bacterium]
MEDSLILDLFFERDENAIRETDSKYGKQLTGISQSITDSKPDAEECVNDTYLAAWNQIPPTRPGNCFAWLCRVVRNISYNVFHKNTAQKRNANTVSLEEELCELISDTGPSCPDENRLGETIDRFLRKQNRDARYLFIRRYFYADSLSALSKLTGISENGVAMRLMRIRKKLKVYLEKEGFTL